MSSAIQLNVHAQIRPIRAKTWLGVSLSEQSTAQESTNQARPVFTNQNTVQARSQPIRVENTFEASQSEQHAGHESGKLSTLWARIQPIIAVSRLSSNQSEHSIGQDSGNQCHTGQVSANQRKQGIGGSQSGQCTGSCRPIRVRHSLGVSKSEQSTIQSQTIRAVCNFKSANQCREMLRVFNRAIYMIGVSHSERCIG